MTEINKWYTKTFTVKREVYTGNKSDLEVAGSFDGHLQQAGPEMQEYLATSWTHSFIVWCAPDTDVLEGDLLIDQSDNQTYYVRTIQENFASGDNIHLELQCERNINEPASI